MPTTSVTAPPDPAPPWHLSAPLVMGLGVATLVGANWLEGSARDVLLCLLGAASLLTGAWMVAHGYARRWRSLTGFLLASIAATATLGLDGLAGTAGLLVGVAVHAGARYLADSRGVPDVPRVVPGDPPAAPTGSEGR